LRIHINLISDYHQKSERHHRGRENRTADERTQAKEHLEKLGGPEFEGRKPVVIFDRRYPSKDLIEYLQDREMKYVMRVQRWFNSRIDALADRGFLRDDDGVEYAGKRSERSE
jgi:hypothetical protein